MHKNVNIYVFSGTGNTLLVANKISETFNKNSYNSTVHKMESVKPQDINLNSTIGIGFTTAFWNTFPFVRTWIDSLPDGNGAETFLFTTMGDSSCAMIAHIAKILEKKNYKIIGAKGFIMPNNFLLVLNDAKNIARIEKNLLKAEEYAKGIINGNGYIKKTNIFSSLAFCISSFVTTKIWKTKLAKKIMKFKVDTKKCNGCGTCATLCPTENIEIKDIPQFKDKCIFCLRCASYCPQQALSNKILLKTYRAVNLKDMLWKK
ncbi:EFR1 family ferrodoxin [Candidatus Ruminimicrobiellum ovillum]|uniref:EFR1 family ferrodoxin n=1 Tax=Candidatus Ruminimicrobiellum ovillum TaxID=1947927 RepID=UPI00355A570C